MERIVNILPPGKKIAIFDRDATIISSRQVAYRCYLEAFQLVICPDNPGMSPFSPEFFWREYHPFQPDLFYFRHYPQLTQDKLAEVRRVSWEYYLAHADDSRMNQPISEMPELLRDLFAAQNTIIILTAGDFIGQHLSNHKIPFHACYSMVRMKKEGLVKNKPDAIQYILDRHKGESAQAVTVGDNPADHVPELSSVGVGFGLGSREARDQIREAVDYYAPDQGSLRRIFSVMLTTG